MTFKNTNLTKEFVIITLDLLNNKTSTDYLNMLTSRTARIQTNHPIKYLPEELDDFSYGFATRLWPHIMFEISDKAD